MLLHWRNVMPEGLLQTCFLLNPTQAQTTDTDKFMTGKHCTSFFPLPFSMTPIEKDVWQVGNELTVPLKEPFIEICGYDNRE